MINEKTPNIRSFMSKRLYGAFKRMPQNVLFN